MTVCDRGEGGSKIIKKSVTYFMDGPKPDCLVNRALCELHPLHVCSSLLSFYMPFYPILFSIVGLITSTHRMLDREKQDEHILEVCGVTQFKKY